MASLSVPVANRRPLSTHGLPKPPRDTSVNRTHRFEGLGFSPRSFIPSMSSPRSPGPMSPPMSAKSFGTVIDSAPSTPAYSPRMEDNWDNSPVMVLRPMSTCSEPSSPTEPVWEMMLPPKEHQPAFHRDNSRFNGRHATTTEITRSPTLSAPPIKRNKSSHTKSLNSVKKIDASAPEVHASHKEEDIEEEAVEQVPETSAPLGRLASKMRSMLRRKSTTDKKKEQKEKDYYDPIEEVHWTEM
jgi:pyruvate dehydrogenase phosphatase